MSVSFCSPPLLEAAEDLDDERVLGEPLAEGAEVLLGEHGRRHEDRDLLAVVDALNAARMASSVLP